jgi:hypothetical protein
MMTRNEAAMLRAGWQLLTPTPTCMHVMLEIELNESGFLTGHYICVVCGEAVAKVPLRPSAPAQ